jgi:hypothetical protein
MNMPLNRAQRRAQEKLDKRARHKPRDERVKGVNTIEVAMSRAAKLNFEEQANVMGVVNMCFDEMKKGTWRVPEWNTLADTLNVAAALASPFNIIADHIEKFHDAMEVMGAIAERVNQGKSWTCYAEEIKTMEVAIEFFCYQIQFASKGEYFGAIDYARRKVAGAVSGSPGKADVHVIRRKE